MPKQTKKGPERREDLVVQKLGEEIIIYDKLAHRAHSLNRPAALVFDRLDGRTDLKGVARGVSKTLGNSHADDIVANAVNDLAAANLLQPGAELPRRSVLRGLAAGLIPVVVTLAVPSAAAAQSCAGPGDPCDTSYDCCGYANCVGSYGSTYCDSSV